MGGVGIVRNEPLLGEKVVWTGRKDVRSAVVKVVGADPMVQGQKTDCRGAFCHESRSGFRPCQTNCPRETCMWGSGCSGLSVNSMRTRVPTVGVVTRRTPGNELRLGVSWFRTVRVAPEEGTGTSKSHPGLTSLLGLPSCLVMAGSGANRLSRRVRT